MEADSVRITRKQEVGRVKFAGRELNFRFADQLDGIAVLLIRCGCARVLGSPTLTPRPPRTPYEDPAQRQAGGCFTQVEPGSAPIDKSERGVIKNKQSPIRWREIRLV